MFNPVFEITDLPQPAPMIVFENVTPDAVFDQVTAYYREGLTYDGLMGIYGNTASETEREAIKQIVTGKDWEIRPAYGDEFVAYASEVVTRKGQLTCICWGRVDADTLESDALHAVGIGDSEFASFLRDLVEEIRNAESELQAERSYYMRRPTRW